MRAALFPYVWRYGEKCHGADGRPSESRSSQVVVARPVLVQEQLRGWRRSVGRPTAAAGQFEGVVDGGPVRGTVAVMAASCPRAPQQHRDVVTVPGVVRHWRG
jgi:hypothetical protein